MNKTPLEEWISRKIDVTPENFTPGELIEYQFAKIRSTLSLVKQRSRFYREKMKDVEIDEINSYHDLQRLPFTTADDIKNDPMKFLCVSQNDIERIVTLQSSGTSGRPKRIFFTRDDQELTTDFFDHGMRNLVDPGDRVMILLPGELPGSVGDLLLTGLNRLGAAPVPYGPVRDAGDAVEHAVKNNITSMVGIPTHFLAMVRNQHGNRLSGKIKSLLLTTDHVPDAVCRIIEKEWGAFPYNHYGMTEMGLGGGVQCAARDGMHLREADLFFEIVDPATGRQLPDGDEGEVVFTTLTRTGMPLIRYRTGDISRFLPYRCPCGTSLRSLEKITKRVSGIIPLEEGNITIADLDEALFPLPGILDFRVHIMKKPDSAEMIIDLKTVPNTKPGQSDIIDALLEIPVVKKLYPDKLRIGIEWNGVEFSVSTGTAKRHIFVV